MGFASSIEARLQAHKTSAPTAQLIQCWPSKKVWEDAAIASISRIDCEQIGIEAFDCKDLSELTQRAEEFFALMPEPSTGWRR